MVRPDDVGLQEARVFQVSRFGVVALAAVVAVGGCTQEAPQPDRSGTVVVTVGTPFASLNGGTAEGRKTRSPPPQG